MRKKSKILEGNSKKIYSTADQGKLILEFKDESVVFDGQKKESVKGKGNINNQISAYFFEYLDGFHIPTHFIKSLSTKDMLVKELEMIPVEVCVRNIIAGSLVKRFGMEEGRELPCPILEFHLKNEKLKNPMVNHSHIVAFDIAMLDELKMIERLSSKINAVLKSFFLRRQIKLIDFKIEFGRLKDKIVLGDEISPDTFRVWDLSNSGETDKDKFSFGSKNAELAYENIKSRILS